MNDHLTVAVCALLAFLSGGICTAADRPNILYFYVDDMGWGSVGPNGQFDRAKQGKPHLLTPALDRLAAEGVNFTRSYGCTVCSPARSSQQSGFHQGHTFADRNDPDNAKKAMRADDILMGDVLSKAGYVTGYWGKWGYGGTKDQVDPKIVNVQTLPTSHGYRHVVAELHHVRAHTFFQPTLWRAPAKSGAIGGLELTLNSMDRYKNNAKYPNQPALQNDPAYPKTAYCDDVYAFAALDFVRAQSVNYNKTSQPFFALLAVQVPHAPFDEVAALPQWDAAYRGQPWFSSLPAQAKQWAAMITRIDGHFQNILQALEDPNGDGDTSDSVADNTLVIFQSDNGGPQHAARVAFAANGGTRGAKGQIHEGGIRIPTLIRWPGKITAASKLKPGTSNDKVIDVTDLLPTFCDLAGVESPLGVDGVSIAPTLTGTGHQRDRAFVIHEAGRGQSIIRGRHKLIRSKSKYTLYDLEADHAEAENIAGNQPALVKQLKELMLAEHVAEPKGFAVTYHDYIGGNQSNPHDADSWSDYTYANAGITYTSETGAPRSSWVARMVNDQASDMSVEIDRDLSVLAFELRGRDASARASVAVNSGGRLSGRNEVRVGSHGVVELNGGTLASYRWTQIDEAGRVSGTGTIDGDVYNRGRLSAGNGGTGELRISGDYHARDSATTNVDRSGEKAVGIRVAGNAYLGGKLNINGVVGKGSRVQAGKAITVISAKRIHGRFTNDQVVASADNGTSYKIAYTPTTVIITPIAGSSSQR